jgi:hypothetical protein
VIVDAAICPDPGAIRLHPIHVAYDLERQAKDPNSLLLAGDLTRSLQRITFPALQTGPSQAVRRWNQRLRARTIIPKMTKEEATRIFDELGVSKNGSLTHSELVWLLRRSPHLEEKLGSKQIKPEELAAFFSACHSLTIFCFSGGSAC